MRLYKHLCKHYTAYSFIANMLNAISMAGLALIGVLTDVMAVTWLVGWGVMFAVIFFIGRFLNQEIDDLEKVMEHNNEHPCKSKK